jgi:uncharacterized protein (DUF697 family)
VQLIGSIIAALAIIAVTIAVVTAQLGPYKEDTDAREQRQEQQEELLEHREEARDRRED